mgnify:CR=1 FL=1|jgi:hypothetical protein
MAKKKERKKEKIRMVCHFRVETIKMALKMTNMIKMMMEEGRINKIKVVIHRTVILILILNKPKRRRKKERN